MNKNEALEWFKTIAASTKHVRDANGIVRLERANAWLAEAHSALESVLPRNHAILRRWETLLPHDKGQRADYLMNLSLRLQELQGQFEAAHGMLRDGRLSTLVAGIQAETVVELLDQADELLASKHVVAATVIAGGALETHLRHLCDRHGLTIVGDGTLSKYTAAIEQARNAGNEIVGKPDTAQIKWWASLRNDAAHSPGTFAHDAAAVSLMIQGIRSFLARVP